MNAHLLAQDSYAATAASVRTPRATEYALLARTTHALTHADGFAALVRALHDNRRLWTTLAADVAEPGNGLPQELRARLFYLSEFTAHHSRKVLAGEADAGALIAINTAVMRGLAGEEAKA
ncbi:flagellar biosynthesis regulator FlaF [Defluviimonas sp. WL0075]|uniref:Flagellar biosynthesis regulator FlaF n=1 Tax=Albidovulum sediminicola TaxID=2984331 RepID=A0ABT2Z525_9RHOB|nr:flagellar biosynthesis regulator FlaF [Defluviimonas sp. WL0075]MCV2866092.1 flagellar biosynthesis regulator FlaF [Defluviimonas sp. WL0075]